MTWSTFIILDQFEQVALGIDRDAFRIEFPGQFRRISAAFDVGDLGCSKCHYFIVFVVTEIDIEVVEVAPGGAHDESTGWHRFSLV